MTIKSFRGQLADGGQDKIRVAGGKLADGYRVVKLQILSALPFQAADEHVCKIYKVEPKVIDAIIDFSDSTLLGAGIINNDSAGYRYSTTSSVIFDNQIFNQDIFIIHKNTDGSSALNYYLELEQAEMSGPESAAVNYRAALTHGG